jgi:transcriptional regulator with XRE-family HTH domain
VPSTRLQQIAQLVRTARVDKGWTQAELADLVGVNAQTIGHIERAIHKPRPELMEKLEATLEADLSAEAQIGHALLDDIYHKLAERMRDLGPVEGIRLATDIQEAVETWQPGRGRGAGGGTLSVVDGDKAAEAEL